MVKFAIIIVMKIYYSSSKYANYTHVHMYVFYTYLMRELKKANLDSQEAIAIDVNIDGNIAKWEITTKDPRVDYIFDNVANRTDYINSGAIKKAVKDIAKKMNRGFEILDLELLISEVSAIKLVNKKPNIKDDDSLSAPAVRFFD